MARLGSAPELVLGIDFGTTKSVMAVVLDDDVEVLQNDIGSRSTPSCVHASMDAGAAVRDVGEAALRLAVSHPLSTVRNVKSVLGRVFHDVGPDHHLGSVKLGQSSFGEGVAIHLEDVVMAAEEVTSMLLVHLKKAAEEQLGRGISNAVIAVPAYFNAAQRRSVVDAAYLAGLRVRLLVNDTSAAALVYARERVEPKTVLVVDVGGGGSSVAVVRTEDGAVRVLAASGRRLPGGEDFDARMVDHFKEVIRQTHGREVTTPRSQEILRGQWENAKHKLSRIPSTKIATFLPDGDIDFQVDVSRAMFEGQCHPLFQVIVDEVKRTLLRAKVAVNQVDDVVLVGGSSRIPALRDMVHSELANRPVCKAVSADEAVAKGVALLAAHCVRLVDVTPLAMRVIAAGEVVDVDANTALPLHRPMPGTSFVVVRQGWRDNFSDDQTSVVTIYEARDIPALTFAIDLSGLFHLFDGRGASMIPILRGCISGPELTRMLGQVKSRIQDEEADRRRIELKNQLEERCRAHLSQEPEAVQGDPDMNLVSDLRRGCESLLQWLDENPAASMGELDDKLAAVTSLWLFLDESRLQRRAASIREAERQTIEGQKIKIMRKKLEEMCLSYLQEQEAAHGDPDANLVATLQRECREQLQWLDSDANMSLEELEGKHASVSSHLLDLEESRARREAQREQVERLQRDFAREQAERMQKELENQREEDVRKQREADKKLDEQRKQRDTVKAWEDQRKPMEANKQRADQMKPMEADKQQEYQSRQTGFMQRRTGKPSNVVEKRPDAGRSHQGRATQPHVQRRHFGNIRNRPSENWYDHSDNPRACFYQVEDPNAQPKSKGAGDDAGPRDPRVALQDSVRQLYKCVFRSEALRRKSFSLQPKDPSSRHPATRVLRALADVEAARALQAASAAGRAVLLVERVAAPGRLLVALSVRFLDGEAGRRPVERLLMLHDALTTSGGDLLDRLDALLAEAGVAVAVRGVAWEEARGPVASAASQLLDLLQARAAAQRRDVIGTALVPTRTWSGSHCLYKRIAAACAEREGSVRALLEAADELQELLGGAGLGVLRRACPAVTPEAWGTLEGVVRVLADPRGLGDVIDALEQLRRLEALTAARLQRLLLALRDSTLHVAARILAAVFAAAKGVADLLAFSGPADLAAVQRCLAALRDVSAVAAAARGSTGGRLRFQSARAASPLVAGVTAAALECVEASVRHSALPLWTRHILVADDDDVFLQDAVRGAEPEDAVQGVGLPHAVRGVEPDALRAVLADLRRFRQQRSDAGAPWRCPRRLLAGCCRAPLRADFPALEDALQALASAAAPTGPCCRHCSAADGEALPVESLRDSLLGAGRCPEDVLEPTMILLSSTDWTATHQHCLDVSRVLEHLCAEDPSEVECSGPQ